MKQLVVVLLLFAFVVPVRAQSPGQGMFDSAGNVVGTLSLLRCDELDRFDAFWNAQTKSPGVADTVIGSYIVGYLIGVVIEFAQYLTAGSATPQEQALAKALSVKWNDYTMSVSIAAQFTRAECSVEDAASVTIPTIAHKLLLRITK